MLSNRRGILQVSVKDLLFTEAWKFTSENIT